MRDAFRMFVNDATGKVDFKGFKGALDHENIQLLATQVSNLFDYIDKDYSGEIDFQEFTNAIFGRSKDGVKENATTRTKQHMASVPHLRNGLRKYFLQDANALAAFQKFRKGKNTDNAEISFNEFKAGLKEFHFEVEDRVARDLFNEIDPSGDGKIDFQEFAQAFFGNDTQRYLARTTDWILDLKKNRTRKRQQKQLATMQLTEPFEVLKRKIRFGFGGISCRLAFRRFKTTLCVKESVDFDGFKKALVFLGITINDKDAYSVFTHVDKDKSGIVDYQEFQEAIYGEENVSSLEAQDWTLRNAREKAKRVAHFTDSANLVRLPSQLYNLLRAMFVSVSSYRQDAFRKFMMTSGTSNSQITVGQMKRAIRLKGLKTAPGIPERLFEHLDRDGSGGLSFREFAKAFFDENMSQKFDLNKSPMRRRRETRVGPAPVTSDPDQEFLEESKVMEKNNLSRSASGAIIILRDKTTRKKVNGASLLQQFRRHKTQSANTNNPTAVDLRGLRDALLAEGITFHNNTLKAIFFELDQNNRGYITFKDFAILSGVRMPPSVKRKSTLPNMRSRSVYVPSPSRHLRRKQRTHSGDKGVRGPSVPRRRRMVLRPSTASLGRPSTPGPRPGTGNSTAKYVKRTTSVWENHGRQAMMARQRRQREDQQKCAWS